jgi:hypothetical protein
MNTFNDDRRNESDELSAMLNDLPEVDPPSSLVGTVMSTIAQSSKASAAQPRIDFTRRGNRMAKNVLWMVAAAAAVALVVMRVAGFPPVDKGTEATIGAAQRYQEPQITAADVKVEDQEFQAFLQSDLFNQLVNDKAAQKALQNENFQRAMADAGVRAALARADVRTEAANFARMDAKTRASLDAKSLATLDAKYKANLDARTFATNNAALNAALHASPALAQALVTPGVADAIATSSLATALARTDAALAISNRAVLDAINRATSNAAANASSNAAANASSNAASNALKN